MNIAVYMSARKESDPEFLVNEQVGVGHVIAGISWLDSTKPPATSNSAGVGHAITGIDWITTVPFNVAQANSAGVSHAITGIEWG